MSSSLPFPRLSGRVSKLKNYLASSPNWIFLVVGATCLICLRPHAFGQLYSLQISAILAFSLVAFVVLSLNSLVFKVNPMMLLQVMLYSSLVIHLTVLAALSGGSFAVDGLKALMMSCVAIAALVMFLSGIRSARVFYNTVFIVLFVSCASIILTWLLIIIGFSKPELVVGRLSDPALGSLSVFFPFSLANGIALSPIGVMPRLTGFFREPGLLPAFACWAAAYAHLRKWPIIFSIVPLVASVCSLSTLGLPLAAYTGSLIALRRVGLGTFSALSIVSILAAVIWPILYSLEYFGLDGKIRSQSGSYDARAGAIRTAFDAQNILFGDGFSSNRLSDATVNSIGRIKESGIFGFVLTVLSTCLPMMSNIFIIGLVPMVITFLFSQPIGTDVTVFMLFLSWTALLNSGERSTAKAG